MTADKEQQIKNSLIYLIPVVTGLVTPFITLPIFTRILTKEDYGVLALAQVYAIFVNGLANFGMTVAYDRNYFQYRGSRSETSKLLYSTLSFVVLNFVFLAALTYFFQTRLSMFIMGSGEHGSMLFWAVCAQFFAGVTYYYMSYFKNSEAAKRFVGYTIAGTLINLVVVLFLVAYFRVGVIGIVYAHAFSAGIIFIILSLKFVTILTPSWDKVIFLESLRISYPLTPRIFLGVIGTQFDKYMIRLLASVGGTGVYSIGQRIAYLVFSFMTAIQNVFAPQVYKRMFDLGKKGGAAVGRYLTPFAYVTVVLALVIALFSEEVITVLTPKSYHGAVNIVTILAMFYALMFFGKQPQLIFAKKTGVTSLLTVMSIGLNVALNVPFIIWWGAIGAAWATLLAAVISRVVTFVVSQHYYKIEWEYKKIGSIFFIFFASAILMILMRHFSVAYEIRLILKCASVFSYIYLGIKLKVITVENYTLIKNMIPLRRVVTSDHS